jgi:protein arginine kinase activator
VVHFTHLVEGLPVTVHLCARCAAEQGIAVPDAADPSPLGAFLATLGPIVPEPDASQVRACPECGATLADIRASGRMGCATCWSTFGQPLRDLVRRLHGSVRHVGEWYDDPASGSDLASSARVAHQRIRLRQALRDAIADEAFETAARLRDELRALEEEQ